MTFNIQNFVRGGSVSAPMSTQPIKAPAGKYLARVATPATEDEVFTKWIVPPKGDRTWWKLAIPFEVFDETLLASMNRKKPITVYSDWNLDLDAATNDIDYSPGKNIDLGRLRAALGQNQPGVDWGLNQTFGQGPIRVEVVHRKNDKNPDDPYVNVRRVEPAVG